MRRKFLRVPAIALPNMLRGGFEPTEPIPSDLRVISFFAETWTNSVRIDLESGSFDLVPEGEAIPEWRPAFRRLD